MFNPDLPITLSKDLSTFEKDLYYDKLKLTTTNALDTTGEHKLSKEELRAMIKNDKK